jgi:hypothetical protein
MDGPCRPEETWGVSRFRLFLSAGLVLGACVGVQQAVANVPGVAADFSSARPATACTSAGAGALKLRNNSTGRVLFVLRARGRQRTVTLAAHSRSKVHFSAAAGRISCTATAA